MANKSIGYSSSQCQKARVRNILHHKLGRFFFNFKTVPFVLPFRSSTVRFTNGFTVPFEVSTNRSDQFFLKMNGFCRNGTNFNGQER